MTEETPRSSAPEQDSLSITPLAARAAEAREVEDGAVGEQTIENPTPQALPVQNGSFVGGTDEAGITRGIGPTQQTGYNGGPDGARSLALPTAPATPTRPEGKGPVSVPNHVHAHVAAPDRADTLRGQLVTVETLKRDAEVTALLQRAGEFMRTLGYTEHGQRHAGLVGHIAENVLSRLDYPERVCRLAHVAGYLHDIGNVIHREHHAQSGALMSYHLLARMGMATEEIALVMNAVGNHEEERGTAITPISSAIIIGDKADVHRSRVQNPEMAAFDIHDRVNYATTRSFVRVRPDERIISLELEIDTNYATVIEYFEIFLSRMTMMRQACEFLNTKFHLIINETRFT